MNELAILGIAAMGLCLWLVSSIIQIKSDLARLNFNLDKIAKHVGVPDTLTEDLKKLILEGQKVEAIKKYRMATGLGLKEAKEYIDDLSN